MYNIRHESLNCNRCKLRCDIDSMYLTNKPTACVDILSIGRGEPNEHLHMKRSNLQSMAHLTGQHAPADPNGYTSSQSNRGIHCSQLSFYSPRFFLFKSDYVCKVNGSVISDQRSVISFGDIIADIYS